MTPNTKYKDLINKIIWFIVPLLIGFFTWLTVMIYGLNTDIKVTQQEARDRGSLQEKIYNKLDQKLDVKIYEIKHEELMNKVNLVQIKVDKIYNKEIHQSFLSKNGEPLRYDTSFLIVKKNLTNNSEKRRGIQE